MKLFTTLRNWMLAAPVALAAVAGSAALAPQALADGFSIRISSGGHRYQHQRPVHRSWADVEFERGYWAGQRHGQELGFEHGYNSHAFHCVCAIDVSCESRPYQDGFAKGFDAGYRTGFNQGARQAEYERCRWEQNRHHQQSRYSNRGYSRPRYGW
ncbi:MAG: hypothetical protein ACR2GY_02130 [Phycisphaerales bacterium]